MIKKLCVLFDATIVKVSDRPPVKCESSADHAVKEDKDV